MSKRGSAGNHLRIPNGTEFKIRLEGPTSRIERVSGKCIDGRFCIPSGAAAGTYQSANGAVEAARSMVESSNAYLYIEFQVGREFVLADDLRHDRRLSWSISKAEELGMDVARSAVESALKKKKQKASSEEIEALAEKIFEANSAFLQEGERRAEAIQDLDISGLR